MPTRKFSVAKPVQVVNVGGTLVRQVDVNGVALDDPSVVYATARPVMPVNSFGTNEDASQTFSVWQKVTVSPKGHPVVRVGADGIPVSTPLSSAGASQGVLHRTFAAVTLTGLSAVSRFPATLSQLLTSVSLTAVAKVSLKGTFAKTLSTITTTTASSLNANTGLSAATLAVPTAANPPIFSSLAIPADWKTNDVLSVQRSQSETFSSGVTTITHTLTDTDITNRTFAINIPTLSTGAPWYFRVFGTHGGVDGNFSNTVAWNDAVAATISTSASQSKMELIPITIALAADKTVTWSITGGADKIQFDIDGSNNLRWINNGVVDYDFPSDVDSNNTYVVIVTATTLAGVITNKTITVTVTAADKQINSFDLGADLAPATPNTDNDSPNAVGTIGGITSGISVPFTITNGTIQKNSTGSYVSSGTVQLGDSLGKLRVHSGSGGADIVVGTVTVGTGGSAVSDSWTVSNSAVTTTLTGTTGTSKNAFVTISGSPPNHFAANAGVGARQGDRATAGKTNAIRVFEFTITTAPSTNQWLYFGIDDNTIDMNAGSPQAPAVDAGNGVAIIMQPTVSGWGWITYVNHVIINSNTNFTAQVGHTLTCVVDRSGGNGTHSVKFYDTTGGVSTLIDTLSSLTLPTTYYPIIGNSSNALGGDMNFGSSAFARTLSGSEIAYG